jgi:hypothetical protein
MKAFINIPDWLVPALWDQARTACRPPRYHLEWLIQQALQPSPSAGHGCAATHDAPRPERPVYGWCDGLETVE